jgi:murein lipoprotein
LWNYRPPAQGAIRIGKSRNGCIVTVRHFTVSKPNKKEVTIMKKSLLVISMMFALAIAVGGCATKSDLEQVQAREKMIGAKADQATQDAQAAKAAADAAALKANEAAVRAEEAVKRAEERERIADEKARIADEKAKKAEAVFQRSMKK